MSVQVETCAQRRPARPVRCADRRHALVPVGRTRQPGPVRVSVSLRTLARRTRGPDGGGCPASPGRGACCLLPGGSGLGPIRPAGLGRGGDDRARTASRTRSHSLGVRLAGSAGQVASTPAVRSARHFAARSVRPAASWAMRTMRSLPRMPPAGPTVQPRRRRAIQAFDGSGRPRCPHRRPARPHRRRSSARPAARRPCPTPDQQPSPPAPPALQRTGVHPSSLPHRYAAHHGRTRYGRSRPRQAAVSGSPIPPSRPRCCHPINDTPRKRSRILSTYSHTTPTPSTPHDVDG